MRKHNLLLSLLSLFIAVFMTACGSSTTNDAKLPSDGAGGGGNQGGVATPVLYFDHQINPDNPKEVIFQGYVENANPEDYNFIWDFGDGNIDDSNVLSVTHTYVEERSYGVTLSANPIDPDNTTALPSSSTAVTVSSSGIVANAFRYSAISGMEYEFQASATATDGADVLYTWNFGDGTVITDTPQNTQRHTFGKYNTEYSITVTAKHSKTGATLPLPTLTIKTPGVTARLFVSDVSGLEKNAYVNFYDSTGALIHGTTGTGGTVTGLENVVYTWEFDNTNQDTSNYTSKFINSNRVMNYIYSSGASAQNYEIHVSATSDTYTGPVTATASTSTRVDYTIDSLTAELTDAYGLQLTVNASGHGESSLSNAVYVFTLPDMSTTEASVTHNAGSGSHTFVYDLPKYYNDYNIKLEVYSNSTKDQKIAERTITIAQPTFRYVFTGPNNGDTYFTKTFTVTPEQNSKALKDAVFNYTFGDGSTTQSSDGTASHIYAGPGTYTVNVTTDSVLLDGTNITVASVGTTFTINADVTMNSINCNNTGAAQNFLQYTCTVDASSPEGTTLNYKWYVDGALDSSSTGTSFTKKFANYNEGHTIKVEASINNSNGASKSISKSITTPNAQVTLTGPTSGLQNEPLTYTATTKVSYNGAEKLITLSNAKYRFRLAEYEAGGSGQISTNTWTKKYATQPSDHEDYPNGVPRTITVEVTAGNLVGTITSNTLVTYITQPAADLQSLGQPVITCRAASDVNKTRQYCKMTVSAAAGQAQTNTPFTDFTAKFIYNGVSYTKTFKNTANIVAGLSSETDEVMIDFNWPNSGDVVTGVPKNQSYAVTGNIYKTGSPNTNTAATPANINLTLDMDYVLFPLPEKSLYFTRGGSGYRFGTWSCGHNEFHTQSDGGVTTPLCGSANSVSGQTLDLGHLVDANGNLKATLKFEWHMRINSMTGTHLADTKIGNTFTVNQGQKPSDDVLRFNISKTLQDNNFRYTGSAYGASNIFYLKIFSDNANTLAKPIKIWYNGANKTGNGNRLQKITPMMTTNGYNSCNIYYAQSGNNLTTKSVTFHVKSARFLFADFDPNQGIRDFIPTDNTYRPFFRFSNKACGANGVCGSATNTTNSTYNSTAPGGLEVGWYFNSNANVVLGNKASISSGLSSGTSTMQIIFKDMLQGSGGAEISDHYRTETCSATY